MQFMNHEHVERGKFYVVLKKTAVSHTYAIYKQEVVLMDALFHSPE